MTGNNEFKAGLFESASGGYYFDDSGTMSPGSAIHNNSRLLKANSVNKHIFEHNPIGALHFKDSKSEVFYRDSKENWFKDKFDAAGIYEGSESLSFSELLNLETLNDNDLNKDSWVGDRIETKIASDGNGLGLYKTMSGAYIIDNNGLQIGNSPVKPIIFTEQVSSKGQTNTSLYDFKYTPSGVVSFEEGGFGVYYQTTVRNVTTWKRDNFNDQGLYQKTDSLNVSQVLNDEAIYDLDISGNLVIGDSIVKGFGSTTPSSAGAEAENLQILSLPYEGDDVTMVAAWAEKNSSNQYDIYYQKFDQQGNKLGKALLFTDENGGNTISNLPTNEFTFEKVIGSSLLVRTSTGDASLIIRDNNVKHGLKFLQLGDGSYVTAWEEIQDSTSVGVGYQRFDSEGNALASELISHTTPRPITTSYLQNPSTSILTIEAGQGINDFTINLNSTAETFSVNETSFTTPSSAGAEAENLQILSLPYEGDDVTMVAAWAEKNSSNQYDIYYQKFDQQGNKLGKALLFTDENGGNTISNLPTNEFTFEKVIGSSLLVRTSTGDASLIIRDNNVKAWVKIFTTRRW